MTGHKIDIFRSVLIHASPLGNHIADVLMILFKPSFLIGDIRITVEHIGSFIAIYLFCVRIFAWF